MVSLTRGLVYSVFEKYGSLVINVASLMILARLLTPTEIGVYAVAAAFVNIAQGLRDFGASSYILQERDLTREKISALTGLCLVIGLSLGIVLALLAHPIATFYGNAQLSRTMMVLSLNLMIVSFSAVTWARLRRELNFHAMMKIGLASSLTIATTSTALAALDVGPDSLAYGSIAGNLITLLMSQASLQDPSFVRPSKNQWGRFAKFGFFSSSSGLLSLVLERAPDLLLGRIVGLEGTALYSRGSSLITLYKKSVTDAIYTVVISSVASIRRDGKDVREPILRVYSYLTVVGWPTLAALAFLAYPIIMIMFGTIWLPAVPVAQILCVGAGLALLGDLGLVVLIALGAVRQNFLSQAISVPAFVVAIGVGGTFGLQGAAMGAAAASILSSVVTLVVLRQQTSITWPDMLQALSKSAGVTIFTVAALGITIEFHQFDLDHLWGPTLLGGFVFSVTWLIGVLLFRHPICNEIPKILPPRFAAWFPSPGTPQSVIKVGRRASFPAGTPPQLLMIVDAEEEFDWSKPLSSQNRTVTNIAAQAPLLDILKARKIKPAYMIDYPVADDPASAAILREALSADLISIGSQLHPWVTPPFEEEVNLHNSFAGNLPPELEHAKLRALTERIEQNLGVRPRIYKAGRYGLGPNTAGILRELGYTIDCSTSPSRSMAHQGGPDYACSPLVPYWLGSTSEILELPLTGGYLGPMGWLAQRSISNRVVMGSARTSFPKILSRLRLTQDIRLTPEGVPLEKAMALTRTLRAQGQELFCVSLHSPSLVVGHTPYVRSQADLTALLEWVRKYCDFFHDEMGGVSTTPDNLYASLTSMKQ